MNIIFFGNSDFSVLPLKQMIESFNVIAVVTAPDSVVGRGQNKTRINPVKELALTHNIPVLQPEKLRNNTEFYQQLTNLNADLHIIVSYGKIIPKDMIDIPKYSTINLHASLLPKLRGASPIQFSLWQGLTNTGNTVQFITEKMDEGDIIDQSHLAIDIEDDYLRLEQKLSTDGALLLQQSVLKIQNNQVNRIAQIHHDATYTKLINKDDGAIYFSMSAEEIYNAFRALKEKPGIYLQLKIGSIKIKDCCINQQIIFLPEDKNLQEGEIIQINETGIYVSCYEGIIIFKQLQAPNKKPMFAKDFANGNRLKIGMILK